MVTVEGMENGVEVTGGGAGVGEPPPDPPPPHAWRSRSDGRNSAILGIFTNPGAGT